MVKVYKVTHEQDMTVAFKIREEVFVKEQKVAKEDEYDEFENTSFHFLAYNDRTPAGTARWRFTDKGIKLERFAVTKEQRGKGVGKALVEEILKDIQKVPAQKEKRIYMHAQASAIPFYEKLGFYKKGEMFEECRIKHYLMELKG